MEVKKSPKAELENKKGIFVEIGLIFVLVILLVAFNYKSYDVKEKVVAERGYTPDIEDKVINTAEENLPPPPPPEETVIDNTRVEITTDTAKAVDLSHLLNQPKENATGGFQKLDDKPKEKEEKEEDIFIVVEEQPSYKGGDEEMYKFLYSRIKYPPLARENNIQGKVTIQFVVEPSGKLSNFTIYRDIGYGCGAEALQAVQQMDNWKPGKQTGKAVRVQVRIPVEFKLK